MKTGRNAPCPCGSGKKYKKCCLQLDQANRGLAVDAPIRQVAAQARAWQADILPMGATFDDEPDARPASLMVTADGLVIFNDLLTRPSAEVDDIAAELHRGIFEAGTAVGSFPPAVEVREGEVAEALAARIRDAGSPIPVRAAPLPGVEKAMAALNQHMGGSATAIVATQPLTWAGWGQPDDWIADVFRASAAYYRARPWRHFDDFPPVLAATPEGRLWYLSILGSGGVEYGLGFYSDADDLDRLLDDPESRPRSRVLGLTFDSERDLRRPARREIARAGWQVASADACPTLVALNTPAGGLRSTDAQDLGAILAAVAAWTEAIDNDRGILSERPWRHAETGVELEVQGYEFEQPELPVIPLGTGGAEGES